MTRAIALFSGGMDSTVLLAHLLRAGYEVDALSVNYGQRHQRELAAALTIAAGFHVKHDVADLTPLRRLLGGSALTSDDVAVPDGHYAEDSMRATVVPNRNAIMLSVAAGVAVARDADVVFTAVHAGDHFVYPDCRPGFIQAISESTEMATDGFGNVTIQAPFVTWTKAEICKHGAELGAPLATSWSCYKGGAHHCGSCGTCYERREAFRDARVPDPTQYLAQPTFKAPA